MKRMNISAMRMLPCVMVIALSLFVVTSCIKDADDDERPQQPAADTVQTITDSTQVVIDSAFKATAEYMRGEWMAQYIGFDPMQMKTSAVRRLVYFSHDGVYDSHVQGIVDIEDTITTYKEFEHEHGTYSFDAARQMMTYTVEYDSLLNFNTDLLEYSPGKMRPGSGFVKEYSEQIWFSMEKDGKRDWVRKDDNLVSVDNHAAGVIYIMKSQQ